MIITCVLSKTVQISNDCYAIRKISKTIDSSSSFDDVLNWAESHGETELFRLEFLELKQESCARINISDMF